MTEAAEVKMISPKEQYMLVIKLSGGYLDLFCSNKICTPSCQLMDNKVLCI